jgi:hypothetical protein
LCDAGQPAGNLLSMNYLTTDCASPNTRNDSVLELRIGEFNQNFEEQKLDEHEINIEDLIDQMEADNCNRKTPLYSGSPFSIYEACVRLINLTQSLNLDKSKTQNLLQEIRYFFPSDCRLPKTVFKLFKITNNINIPQVRMPFILSFMKCTMYFVRCLLIV